MAEPWRECGPEPWEAQAAFPTAGPEVPPDLVPLGGPLDLWEDRSLGYFGGARFVAFRYDALRRAVTWDDGCRRGVASGAWHVVLDRIAPPAGPREADVRGGESAAGDVLLIDRTALRAYLAPRDCARRFLARQAPGRCA